MTLAEATGADTRGSLPFRLRSAPDQVRLEFILSKPKSAFLSPPKAIRN